MAADIHGLEILDVHDEMRNPRQGEPNGPLARDVPNRHVRIDDIHDAEIEFRLPVRQHAGRDYAAIGFDLELPLVVATTTHARLYPELLSEPYRAERRVSTERRV